MRVLSEQDATGVRITGGGPVITETFSLVASEGPDNIAWDITERADAFLDRVVALTFGAKNLTNDEREQFYSTPFLVNDVTRRTYKTGVTWSLSIGGVINF